MDFTIDNVVVINIRAVIPSEPGATLNCPGFAGLPAESVFQGPFLFSCQPIPRPLIFLAAVGSLSPRQDRDR